MPDANLPAERPPVLRGTVAESAAAAKFGVDLRRETPVDSAPVERAKQQARTADDRLGQLEGMRQDRLPHLVQVRR